MSDDENNISYLPGMGPDVPVASEVGMDGDVIITPPTSEPREDLREVQVLIIDDNKFHRSMVKNALSMNGIHSLKEADSAETAIKALSENTFELIVIDYEMPGESGLDLTRRIRLGETKASPEIPMIMVSAFGESDVITEARNVGVHEFVLKPFSVSTLMERIKTTFKHPRKFVRAPGYVGPDRRWLEAGPLNGDERRTEKDSEEGESEQKSLRERLSTA